MKKEENENTPAKYSDNFKITELEGKGIIVLYLKGNFIGGDETDELRNILKEFSNSGNKKLIMHLGEVLYLNTTAIAILISAHANYSKREGKIKLCLLNKNLINLFDITKLALLLENYPNEEDAVKSFG